MAYNSKIDTVYNHYLTAYAPKSTNTKYDAHKKSELRGIYNSMLKLNKDAPLYILDQGKESRDFVVQLKEDARDLRNTIADLGGLNDDQMFSKKSAYSTDEDMVSAKYIGDVDEGKNAPSFDIEVVKLASDQENLGKVLKSDDPAAMEPGTYSFDINIDDLSYEFQFSIRDDDTNHDLQERLMRLVNKANIGIKADIVKADDESAALRLSSDSPGLKNGSSSIFNVSDDRTSKLSGSVEYLGIDYVSKAASDAEFLLNGQERSASSNHFTIDSKYEINLNGVRSREGHKATVGVKTDLDSITENVEKLFDRYNSFINTASDYKDLHPSCGKLLSEMDRMVSFYSDQLKGLGVSEDEKGDLKLNERAFKSALSTDDEYSKLKTIRSFAGAMLDKANRISLNPIEYMDKKIVAYKNPGHNFTAPYVSSNYSGVFFNNYC